MTITVFGATGMVGKYVVTKALGHGHKVIAFGRHVERLIDADLEDENLEAAKGYVFDKDDVYKAIKGSDAVISVLGGAFDGTDKTRSLGIKNIIAQMEKAGVPRIVALGGLGILQADGEELVMDKPDYPQQYLPVGKEHLQAYHFLKESVLEWTIVGAPDLVDEDATGNYTTSSEYPPQTGIGKINVGDLAEFMIIEALNKRYLHQRVGISNT